MYRSVKQDALQEKKRGVRETGKKNVRAYTGARNSSCPSPWKTAGTQSRIPGSSACSESRESGLVCGSDD